MEPSCPKQEYSLFTKQPTLTESLFSWVDGKWRFLAGNIFITKYVAVKAANSESDSLYTDGQMKYYRFLKDFFTFFSFYHVNNNFS